MPASDFTTPRTVIWSIARHRFPVLQLGPLERETTGLRNGSRLPSAVMVFVAFGVAAAGDSDFAAVGATALVDFCARCCCDFAAVDADAVFCSPCLGCTFTGDTALLIGADFFRAGG